MDDLNNVVRREAERVMGTRATTRLATITSYDPSTYSCKVALQPEGAETGWCPIASIQVGNGYGIYTPPRPGDQAVVVFQEDNVETPVVVGFLYNDVDRAATVPAGEVHIVHEAGNKVVLKPGGVIEVTGTDIRVGPSGATLRTLVTQAFQTLFNLHTHPADNTPPTQQMTAAHLTVALKGG